MKFPYIPPLSIDEFLKLDSDNITILENKELILKIEKRSLYIFERISQILNLNFSWVTFDTIDLERHKNENNGTFSYNKYKDYISFYSDLEELEHLNKIIDVYYNKFPTKFIYENFENEVLETISKIKKSIEEKKERNKKKRIKEKQNKIERDKIRPEVIASIKSKLTELELSFIDFK
jgi:hypothetical protein